MALGRENRVLVHGISKGCARGVLRLGATVVIPCALGRSGRTARKREGDGASPIGRWRVLEVLYRADRVRRPRTALKVRAIRPYDGWCDAPEDRNYNRPVDLPYPASAERMWRDDCLYDVVVVLGYNDRPRVRGRGSAIFLHVAQPGFTPTEGCIALDLAGVMRLLARLRRGDRIVVRA